MASALRFSLSMYNSMRKPRKTTASEKLLTISPHHLSFINFTLRVRFLHKQALAANQRFQSIKSKFYLWICPEDRSFHLLGCTLFTCSHAFYKRPVFVFSLIKPQIKEDTKWERPTEFLIYFFVILIKSLREVKSFTVDLPGLQKPTE